MAVAQGSGYGQRWGWGGYAVSVLSSTSLSPLQFFLAASWLFQGSGFTAAGGPGGDNWSWSVQILWGAAGWGFGHIA